MAEDSSSPAAPAGAPSAAAAPSSPPPWHQGVEPEILGTWQNKGYDLSDAKKVAVEATKAYREAQGKLGIPANEILRMIKPDSQPSEIKSFWAKLGAPEKPEGYDFSGVKFADGSELDAPFVDTMRAAFVANNLPKDAAAEITKAVVKFMDGAEAENKASVTATRQVESAELQKEWGKDFEGNLFIAKRGAELLGLDKAAIDAMENVAGWGKIMRAFHKVGVLNKEDRFISGGQDRGGVMTREQAQARKADLMKDEGWVKRYMAADVAARQEMENLNRVIVGYFEAA